MDTKSKPPNFEDTYRRHEFVPLVTLATTLAEWVKVRSTDNLARHQTVGSESSSGNADSSR